jgi:hypothetical protein
MKAMTDVIVDPSARYSDDLTFHQTSGSGVLDQQECRRTIGSKSARCHFSFKQLNPMPVCQPSGLIVSSKKLHFI